MREGMEQRTMLWGASNMTAYQSQDQTTAHWAGQLGLGMGGRPSYVMTVCICIKDSDIRHDLSLSPPLSTIIVVRFLLVNTNIDNNI